MHRVWTIARKEWKGFFDHATAYILLVVFLVLNFFFYFRSAFVLREASLRTLFELLPWLLFFFAPAITMRALAEEKRSGTLELVLAQPLNEAELLLGKFLGSLLFIWTGLGATLGVAIGAHAAGDPDTGMMVGQYIGGALAAALFTAVGIWASSLTRNQITAFVVSVAIGFLFIVLGLDVVLYAVPAWAGEFVGRLAILPHYQAMSRGVLDSRDILYFLSVAATFLFLAYVGLLRDRANRRSPAYRNLQVSTALVPAVAIALNLAGGLLGLRLDLTESRLYTLSPATKRILRELDDIVTLKLFASSELPPQIALTRRDVRDLLSDYRRAAGGRIELVIRAPDKDEAAREEASTLGIPPVQFNVLREDEFQVTQGYLGIAVQYAGSSEVVPFVRDLGDLEYRLTSAIRALTVLDTPQVGFLSGHGEKSPFREYGAWRREMESLYRVTEVRLPADTATLKELDVLVVAGPAQLVSDTVRDLLKRYLNDGGRGMFLIDRVTVNPQLLQGMPSPYHFSDFVEEFGAKVEPDLVYDLRSNETVTFGGGFVSVIVPYPFWVRALPAQTPITRDLSGAIFPWASPIESVDTSRYELQPLWTTSTFAVRERAPWDLNPQRSFRPGSPDDLDERVLAATVRPKGAAAETRWRIVVVGDSDFLTDAFVRSAPQNVAFAINAVDWLAEDEALIAIRSRQAGPRPLVFSSEAQRTGIKWGNLLGVPLLLVLLGGWRMWNRRSLQNLAYVPPPPPPARSEETGSEPAGPAA